MTAIPTRRAILAGAVSLPALSLPAIAAANPDAKLLELGREQVAIHEQMMATEILMDEADKRSKSVKRVEIKPPRKYAKMWKTILHGEYQRLPKNHPLKVWNRKTDAQMTANYRNWMREVDRRNMESGYTAAEEQYGVLHDMLWALARKIFAVPAQTAAGMLVKAESLRLRAIEDDMEDGIKDAWESIVADINRIAKSGLALG